MRLPPSAAVLGLLLAVASVWSAEPVSHAPDPLAVQRHDAGYRYPQAGWTVLHIEGEPYARGFQHGRLMAADIAAFVRSFAATQSPKAPEEGWRITRTLTNALFLRRFEREYLEEMKGIADGAAAAGAKFDGRPIDLVDIATINCWAEIETLDGALQATPTGLEGVKFPREGPRKMPAPPEGHCSAFAATGPATADGRIVFGHITMFGLYPANHFNVWLDVKPAAGRRVLMQTYPGGIQSGMDYYQNDAGLMVCETTISQTRFNDRGKTLASRIRKALQYSSSIDELVTHLTTENNGLYTNEWLIGDAKTDEIAMLQLGTGKFKLSRSGKNEWFGGTPGFYWGCNNTKELDLRLEAIPGPNDRPANVVWRASDRDRKWQELYHRQKGTIDAGFAKLAFTTPPLAAYHSLDAKFTTSALAKELKSVALFGPPLGRAWLPTDDEKRDYPAIRPLVSHPWTVLHGGPPPAGGAGRVVDLHNHVTDPPTAAVVPPTVPAWRGTLLPKTDGDIWLAAAFAEYEKIVALDNVLRQASAGLLSAAARDRLAVELNAYRSEFTEGGAGLPVTLSAVRRNDAEGRWYRQAVGKGVCVLHELRRTLTPAVFDAAMDSFGVRFAGRAVTTAEFQKHVEAASGKQLGAFFDFWVRGDRLPSAADEPNGATTADGRRVTVRTFRPELEETLIVYGTKDDAAANRDAARVLQDALRISGPNITVAVKADHEVVGGKPGGQHLLLVGGPATNRVTESLAGGPVRWGRRSFTVRGETYANARSAVIYAVPHADGRSAVVIAGLGAEATWAAAARFTGVTGKAANAVVLPAGGEPRELVIPNRDATQAAAAR